MGRLFRCGVEQEEVLAGRLASFPAVVLSPVDIKEVDDDVSAAIRKYVAEGGTLLCDLPILPDTSGSGPSGDWSKVVGFRYGDVRSRGRFTLANDQLGHVELVAADKEFLSHVGGNDLGHWQVVPAAKARVSRDSSGRPSLVTHRYGRGKVVTFCFRFASVDPSPNSQIQLAKLLAHELAKSNVIPLVDAPWVEKTILPQANGGLLVAAWNPRDVAVHSPMRLPQRERPQVSAIYAPLGGEASVDHITLPPRSWVVFAVE